MPYIQTIIVLLVVAGAAFYLIRRLYNNLKKSDSPPCGCSCGCSGCSVSQTCEESQPPQS